MLPTSASQVWCFAVHASVSVWRSSASPVLNHSIFFSLQSVEYPDWMHQWWNSTFFFAIVVKYFITPPPHIWKSTLLHLIDRDGYFWPEMTEGKVLCYSSRFMSIGSYSVSLAWATSRALPLLEEVLFVDPLSPNMPFFSPISSFPSSCASHPLASYSGAIALFYHSFSIVAFHVYLQIAFILSEFHLFPPVV